MWDVFDLHVQRSPDRPLTRAKRLAAPHFRGDHLRRCGRLYHLWQLGGEAVMRQRRPVADGDGLHQRGGDSERMDFPGIERRAHSINAALEDGDLAGSVQPAEELGKMPVRKPLPPGQRTERLTGKERPQLLHGGLQQADAL